MALPTFAAAETYRFGFPSAHSLFHGQLPIGRVDVARTLAAYDFVLVVGAQAFRYHQYQEGEFLSPDTDVLSITHDPDQAAYTQFGDTILADPTSTLVDLAAVAPSPARHSPAVREVPEVGEVSSDAPFDPAYVLRVINATQLPGTAYVTETPSTESLVLRHIHTTAAGSFYFPAAGGLGFGLPASIGVALARSDRPVTAIIGDGSAQYGITALWTAARGSVPLVICYLRNGSCQALKHFAQFLGTTGVPGLDLPNIDILALAKGYGVTAHTITTGDHLAETLREARNIKGPVLLDIPITATPA